MVGRVLRNRYVLVLGLLSLATVAWNLYVVAHAHGIVTGWVIGPDGQPVTDATVTLFERTLTTLEPRSTTRTGPDGRFRFTGHRAHHLVLEAAKGGVGRSPRVSFRLYFRDQDLPAQSLHLR